MRPLILRSRIVELAAAMLASHAVPYRETPEAARNGAPAFTWLPTFSDDDHRHFQKRFRDDAARIERAERRRQKKRSKNLRLAALGAIGRVS